MKRMNKNDAIDYERKSIKEEGYLERQSVCHPYARSVRSEK